MRVVRRTIAEPTSTGTRASVFSGDTHRRCGAHGRHFACTTSTLFTRTTHGHSRWLFDVLRRLARTERHGERSDTVRPCECRRVFRIRAPSHAYISHCQRCGTIGYPNNNNKNKFICNPKLNFKQKMLQSKGFVFCI